MEQLVIDAARPAHQPAESARGKLLRQRLRRDHRPRAAIVKTPQQRIGHADRQPRAGVNIFGKARVIAGREAPAQAQAAGARRQPHGPFGRDMDMVIALRQPFRHRSRRREGELDLRIGRHGNGGEILRGQEIDRCAERARRARHRLQGTHDAVDLRTPSVRRDQYPHQAAALASVMGCGCAAASASAAASCSLAVLCQSRISKRPSACSAMAVQLSTKSPVFT